MKIIFAETRRNEKLSKEIIKRIIITLPKKIAIFSSVQYLNQLKELEKALKAQGKIIIKAKNTLSYYPSQILGCDVSGILKLKDKVEAFLIMGSKFHSLLTAIKSGKPVFYYSEGKIEKISEQEILSIKAKQKTALIKFYSSDIIGILVSLKPGQEKMKLAEKIKEKVEKTGKRAIIFISNNVNIEEFENFSIPVYINSACPAMMYDSNKIINYSDIPELN